MNNENEDYLAPGEDFYTLFYFSYSGDCQSKFYCSVYCPEPEIAHIAGSDCPEDLAAKRPAESNLCQFNYSDSGDHNC